MRSIRAFAHSQQVYVVCKMKFADGHFCEEIDGWCPSSDWGIVLSVTKLNSVGKVRPAVSHSNSGAKELGQMIVQENVTNVDLVESLYCTKNMIQVVLNCMPDTCLMP